MTEPSIEALNRQAPNTSGVRSDFLYGSILEQKRYLFALGHVQDREVLDCASGIGWGSFVMAAGGARRVVGVELSAEAVASACKYYSFDALTYVQRPLAQAGLPAGSFDLITSFETLEHVEQPLEFLKALRSLARPQAVLFLSTPNAHAFKNPGEAPYNPFHINEFSRDEVTGMLGQTGWRVREYRGQHLMPRDSAEITAYRRFVRRYWAGEKRAASALGLPYRAMSFIGRRLGFALSEPAFAGHCDPVPVPQSHEPAYHYFVLAPR